MMCLWRLVTLSRLIVLHSIAFSAFPGGHPHGVLAHYRDANRNAPSSSNYCSLGRLSFPTSSSWSSLIQDSIQDICSRMIRSSELVFRQRRSFLHLTSADDFLDLKPSAVFAQETQMGTSNTVPQSPPSENNNIVKDCVLEDFETVPNENEYLNTWKAALTQVWPSTEDQSLNSKENIFDVSNMDLSPGNVDSDTPTLRVVQEVVRRKRKSKRKESSLENDGTDTNAETLQRRYIESLTQPLMTERVWNQLTGTEWGSTTSTTEEPNHSLLLLDALTNMGENVARVDTPTDWIDWRVYGDKSSSTALVDGAIQVWVGRCCATPPKGPSDEDDRYLGIQLPFIKTRAMLPYSIPELVDLLLDSNKVVTYNPWSLGRKDCWIDDSSTAKMTTKIVQNRVQPPIPGARPVVSTTLLHARPLLSNTIPSASNSKKSSSENSDDNSSTSWIIVSRSIGNKHIYLDPSDSSSSSRSDILFGVNLLEPVVSTDGKIDPNSCILTAVAHVYSPSVPLVLAERLGVQSAIKFVQDLRNLKTVTAAPIPNAAAVAAVRQVSMRTD